LHTKYNTSRPSHEAGYDSLVTARVLIRQAARLYSLDSWTSSDEEQFFTPPDNLSVLAPRPAYYLKADPILNHSGPPLGTQTLPLRQTSNAPQPKSKFATVNSYDLLGNSGTPSSSSDESRSRTAPVPVPLRSQQHVEQNILDFMPADQGVASTVEMVDGICAYIPDWNNEFWNIFGNKLRVNGTEEGVLELM
jgi:poly(A)-specific ribonuclease